MAVLVTVASGTEPTAPPSPRNMVFASPFCGYSPVNYDKKVDILDTDGTISRRPGDLSFPLLDLIRRAQKSIDIACYLYSTLTPEHLEIAKASRRGVKIRLFLDTSIRDKNNAPVVSEVVEQMKESRLGIPIKVIDPAKAEKATGIAFQTMHEKFGVIDGRHVFTGSANIEPGANTKYAEDRFFFLDNPAAAKAFQQEFDRLWEMGQYLLPPGEEAKR